MSLHAWIVLALVGPAVLLTIVSAIGALAMRDPFQRLHFIAPPATLSAFAIAIAALYDGKGLQPGGKALVVAVVLTVMNGVATHAIARAAWVRGIGRWVPEPERADQVVQHAMDPSADRWEDPA